MSTCSRGSTEQSTAAATAAVASTCSTRRAQCEPTNLLAHRRTRSLATDLLIYPRTRGTSTSTYFGRPTAYFLTYSLTHLPTYLLTYPLTYLLTHPLTYCSTARPARLRRQGTVRRRPRCGPTSRPCWRGVAASRVARDSHSIPNSDLNLSSRESALLQRSTLGADLGIGGLWGRHWF